MNDYVQLACLPNPTYATYYPPDNSIVYASGWGMLSYGGSSPQVLYNVRLNTYPFSYCANTLSIVTSSSNNTELCAGIYTGGKDTCDGMFSSIVFNQSCLTITYY